MKPLYFGICPLCLLDGITAEIATEKLLVYLRNFRRLHFVKCVIFAGSSIRIHHGKQNSRYIEHGCSRAELSHIDQATFISLNHDIVNIEVTVNAGVGFGNKVKKTMQTLSFFIGDARDIGNIRTVCFLEGWNLRVGCMYSVNLFAGIRVHFHIFIKIFLVGTDQFSQRF